MISPTSLEILDAFEAGEALSISSASALIEETSSGTNERINHLADVERKAAVGDEVTYIVNANVNFTNVCYTDCKYCGF